VTASRKLYLQAYDYFQFFDLIKAIKDAIRLSPYTQTHRFASFAPERENAICNWFIDGEVKR
jgi:hypothetical protein